MKALVYNQTGTLDYNDAATPSIQHAEDVLLRIKATGICGTDIHILNGEYNAKPGIVMGHESTAVVEDVGSAVTHIKVGDRVALDPTYHCSVCHYCQTGRPNYCEAKSTTETGVSSDGTFAPLHVARAAFVHPLPEEVSFELGTLTEPLACILNALQQTRIRVDSRVLVVGMGPIGLLSAITAQRMGCQVTVGERDEYRLAAAREIFDDVQDYKAMSLCAANETRRYDIIIDTSGRVLKEALHIVDRGGDILLLGLDYSLEVSFCPSDLTDRGVRLVGSIDSNRTILPALQLLRRHPAYQQIISHSLPLTDYQQAFALLGVNLGEKSRNPIKANKVFLCPDF